MTLPAGYTGPLFRHLSEREYRTIDYYVQLCKEGIDCGYLDWFDVLYEEDPRKLPIVHLTYLVCSLIGDKVPIYSKSRGYRRGDNFNVERVRDHRRGFVDPDTKEIYGVWGDYSKEQWSDIRLVRSKLQKICEKLKKKLGHSWSQDIKAAEKKIRKDLLTLHTHDDYQKIPRKNILDFKVKSAELEALAAYSPEVYATYSIWDDIVKGKIPPFEDHSDYYDELGRRQEKYLKVLDPQETLPKTRVQEAEYDEETGTYKDIYQFEPDTYHQDILFKYFDHDDTRDEPNDPDYIELREKWLSEGYI